MERRKGATEFFEKWKRIAIVILKDLSLLASLYLAQFIVWRTLRTRHKEHIARKKNLRLISRGEPSPDIDKEMKVASSVHFRSQSSTAAVAGYDADASSGSNLDPIKIKNQWLR